jgi:eukaryotic-like serine/threonine-protein kinase
VSANASPGLHDSAPDEPPAEALLGRVLGQRYELEAVLGRGSIGTVYRARHRRLDRMMAVKVLRPALVGDAEAAQRFDREALAVSKLDHENCVQVIDFGCEDGLKYLVMQQLEGPSLRELMGGPVPVGRAVGLVVQILHGLEHAHRRGLVHRDLKPENVIVVRGQGGRDTAKLVDFGLAQLLDAPATQRRLTQAGIVFGTPLYMSPEQATGGRVDPRTDLYAAGVILYELLSGEPPFFDQDPATLAAMHVTREPPPLPHGVPLGLAPVIRKLLAKRGDDRFRTARAAASALQRALSATMSTSAGPRTTAPYTDPAALASAAALVAVGPASPRRPAQGPGRPTLSPFRPARPDPPGGADHVDRRTHREPVRTRKTTSIDATLPSRSTPGDRSRTPPPVALRPARGRGLWIAPVSAGDLERHAAFANVDHALVQRPEQRPARWTRTRTWLAALALLATAIALVWLSAA